MHAHPNLYLSYHTQTGERFLSNIGQLEENYRGTGRRYGFALLRIVVLPQETAHPDWTEAER